MEQPVVTSEMAYWAWSHRTNYQGKAAVWKVLSMSLRMVSSHKLLQMHHNQTAEDRTHLTVESIGHEKSARRDKRMCSKTHQALAEFIKRYAWCNHPRGGERSKT